MVEAVIKVPEEIRGMLLIKINPKPSGHTDFAHIHVLSFDLAYLNS